LPPVFPTAAHFAEGGSVETPGKAGMTPKLLYNVKKNESQFLVFYEVITTVEIACSAAWQKKGN
jgi:hypothetical protein